MMFDEWVDKYGLESAQRQFRTKKHLVFVVKPHKYVFGICGSWRGNEPLGNTIRNPSIEIAKQRIRDALCNSFETETTLYDNSGG